METRQKLILLNGFAGTGKTTIAKRYIDEHPLDLSIEGDHIIVMLGQWLNFENEARDLVFSLTKSMVTTHLTNGKSVLLPYLLTNSQHAVEFENIAVQYDASFYEVYLSLDKNEAVKRLIERGTWGAKLTDMDMPEINELFDSMEKETLKRPNSIIIKPMKNNIEQTYQEFLKAIDESVR